MNSIVSSASSSPVRLAAAGPRHTGGSAARTPRRRRRRGAWIPITVVTASALGGCGTEPAPTSGAEPVATTSTSAPPTSTTSVAPVTSTLAPTSSTPSGTRTASGPRETDSGGVAWVPSEFDEGVWKDRSQWMQDVELDVLGPQDMGPFLAQARAADAALARVSDLARRGMTANRVRGSKATAAALADAWTLVRGLDAVVPSHVDGELRDALVTVYADLASRLGLLRDFVDPSLSLGPVTGEDEWGAAAVRGLMAKEGVTAKAFPADLARLERATKAAGRLPSVRPDSVHRAETRAMIEVASSQNLCCMEHGGWLPKQPLRVVWLRSVPGYRIGTLRDWPGSRFALFQAAYLRGRWTVDMTAG